MLKVTKRSLEKKKEVKGKHIKKKYQKENCFFYGCNKAADEGILSWTKTRLLPKIYASVEEIFDYQSCRFKQDKHKLNSARVVVWNEMKVTNSFTLETSMYAKSHYKGIERES